MINIAESCKTERLRIRRLELGDAQPIFDSYGGDERVARYMTWPVSKTVGDVTAFISGAIASWETGLAFEFVVEELESGALVGGVGMHQFVKNDDAHYVFGYCFSPSVWGRGYATEVSRWLVRWFDDTTEVYRFSAWVDVENPASCRVLEKAGLQREGILRRWIVHPNVSKEPRDVIVFSRVK